MKYFLTIAVLFPLCIWAQDCKLNKETDPYTKETKISTGFIELEGGSVTIDANAQEIDVFFSLEGSDKCFDNNSMAAIFFEGTKAKMTSRNGGSMNCEGFFHFIFKNNVTTTTSLLQKLSAQKVTSIAFTGNNKKETKITLTPEQQQILLSFTNCLVNEAKKLVKQ